MNNIRKFIQNQYIWISIDETTDSTGKNITNVILGVLSSDEETSKKKKRFLIHTAELNKTNHMTIARLFDDAIKILDPNFNKNLILLFVTDAAPYMVKAGKSIVVFYPKMLHVTCIAHGLRRLCERIRDSYENVNKVISNVKKVFLKAPNRVDIFKEMYPDLSLPPEPIITRWGTWHSAVNYYTNNYEQILNVLNVLNSEESQSINISKEILKNPKTKTDFIFIASNFCFIEYFIKKLEKIGLTLEEQYDMVSKTVSNVEKVPNCSIKNNIKTKFTQIINKNECLEIINNICMELKGSSTKHVIKYDAKEIVAFKYAPITSVDVERSFSMYKNLVRCNRQRFLFENLSQYFVVHCNSKLN